MPNPNQAFGLRPVRTISGAPWNAQLKRVYFAAGESNAIFIGDPVVLAGASDTPGNYPTVTIASAGATNSIYGVVVGFDTDPTDLTLLHRKASTARYGYVVIDPHVIFEVQCSGTLAYTDVGANAVLTAGGGGSTTTGYSSWALYNTTTPAADATFQLNIMGVSHRPNNTIGQYCVVDVTLNLSTQRAVYSAHASAWYGALGV